MSVLKPPAKITVYGTGNTTSGSSGTMNASSLNISGGGDVSVGMTGNTLVIYSPPGGGAAQLSAGTQLGNGTGTILFQNANGVSFGMNNSSVITASVANLGSISASQVQVGVVGTPSDYTNVQRVNDGLRSAGHISGGLITLVSPGIVNVSAGLGLIRATNDPTAALFSFQWPVATNLTIPTNTIRYIVAEYNGGTPRVVVYTAETYDYNTSFPLGIVTNENGDTYISNSAHHVGDAPGSNVRRLYEVEGRARANELGGLILSESGVKHLAVTTGVTWLRGERTVFPALDTNVIGGFDRHYRDGVGGWINEEDATVLPEGTWDNGTGILATLVNGHFATYWFYLGSSSVVHMVYGRGDHPTVAEAEGELIPGDLPLSLQEGAMILGRIVMYKDGGGIVSVQQVDSAFSSTFVAGGVAVHANLAGLGANDHTQYQLRSQGVINTIVAGGSTFTTNAVSFGNANGFSFITTNGSVGGSYSITAGLDTLGMSNLGNTSGTSGVVSGGQVQLVFAGGNNVTLSQSISSNSGTITISAASQSAESNSIGMSNLGNTSGTTGVVSGNQFRMVLAGGNNVTLSQSLNGASGTITVSAANQSVQTQGLIQAISGTNSTGGASSFSGSGAVLAQANGFSFIVSNNSISGSYTVPTVTAGSDTFGMSNLGNTLGTSGVVSGDSVRMLFAGGNNITLSQSLNGASGTITISAASQTNQTIGLYAGGNTTGQSSSSTFDARSLSFSGAGVASVGYSGGSVIISVPAGGGGGDGFNIVSMLSSTSGGGTAGATFSTLSGSIGLMAGSNITLSQTSNTIVINAQSQSAESNTFGISNLGNSIGTSGIISGNKVQMLFAGGNNITLSQSLNGSSGTITISAAAQTTQSAIKGFGASNTGTTLGNTGIFTGVDWVVAASGGITASGSTTNATGPHTLWLSVPSQSVQTQGLIPSVSGTNSTGGGSSFSGSAIQLMQANGFSFIVSNNSVSGSYTVPTQTTQSAIKGLGVSNTGTTLGNTGISSGVDWVVAASGNITASQSTAGGGPNTIWLSVPSQSVQTQGLIPSVSGTNSTGGGSSFSGSAIQLMQANGFSFVVSSNSISGSYTVPTVTAGSDTFGVSNLGNTLGTSGVVSGDSVRMLFAGGNNITLSQSLNGASGTITISAASQSIQTQSLIQAVSGTNSTGGASNFAGSGMVLAQANGFSFIVSNNSISGSYTVPTQTNQQMTLFATGNTTQSSTGTTNASSLIFAASGIVSVGITNGSVLISASAAQTNQSAIKGLGVSNTGTTLGNTGISTGVDWVIAGSGNITASQSTAGGGPNTIWLSVPSQTVQTQGLIPSVSGTNSTGGGSSFSGSAIQLMQANGFSFIVSNNSVSGSYTVPTQTNQSAIKGLGVSNTGTTAGNTGLFTGVDWVVAASGNITASGSTTNATGPHTLWLSVPAGVGAAISAAGGSQNTGTVIFSNSNGISFGYNAGTITATVTPGAAAGVAAAAAGTQTQTSGTLVFANSNNFTFGMSGSSQVTASYAQSTQPAIKGLGVSNTGTTLGNTGTFTGVDWAIAASGNITASGSTTNATGPHTLWLSVPSQSIQTQSLIQAVSGTNSTGGASNFAGSGMVLAQANGFSFIVSNNSVSGSYTVPTQTNQSAIKGFGVSNTGTTLGNTGISTGVDWVIAGSGNVTASQSTAGGGPNTVWISVPSQTVQTQGLIPSVSGTNSTGGGSSFSGSAIQLMQANGFSFIVSSNSISGSYTVPTQTNQTAGLYAVGNTTGQSSSSTFDARTLSFSGAGIASVGYSGGNVIISVPAGGGGGIAAAAGTQTQTSGTLAFVNSNNFTFGMSNSSQVTASFSESTHAHTFNQVAAGTQTAANGSTVVFSNSNNVTFGMTNSSIVTASFSYTQSTAPSGIAGSGASTVTNGTVVFANGNNVSFGLNGSTMTASIADMAIAAGGVTLTAQTGTLAFSNSNNISFGLGGAGSTIMTASASFAQTTQSAIKGFGVSNTGTTAGNTGLFTGVDWVVAASGNITASGSTTNATGPHTLWLSVPTGGGGGAAISAAGGSQSTGTVVFSNSNGVSFGFNNGTITATVTPGAAAGIGAVIAGTQTQTSGTLSFVNSNSITWGMSNNSQITMSYGDLDNAIAVVGSTFASNASGTLVFSNSNGVSFGMNGSTMTASVAQPFDLFWEPEFIGTTNSITAPNGTLFIQPLDVAQNLDIVRCDLLKHHTSQSATTMWASGSVSNQTSTSDTGNWLGTITAVLFSRSQTNATQASYNSIVTFFSTNYTTSYGMSATWSNSTNVSSATVRVTHSFQWGGIQNLDMNGGSTTFGTGLTSSTSITSNSTNLNSFSNSFVLSIGSQQMSGPRFQHIPFNTSLSPGDYWIGFILSTTSNSNVISRMERQVMQNGALVCFATMNSGYYEMGQTAAISSFNNRYGQGSYSNSAGTTGTIALSNITSYVSNATIYFQLNGLTL